MMAINAQKLINEYRHHAQFQATQYVYLVVGKPAIGVNLTMFVSRRDKYTLDGSGTVYPPPVSDKDTSRYVLDSEEDLMAILAMMEL